MRLLLVLFVAFPLVAQEWPLHFAEYSIEILKASGLEPEDPHWMHLHAGHHSAAPSDAVPLKVNIFRGSRSAAETLAPAASGVEIRYTVHGVPVSDWLAPAADRQSSARCAVGRISRHQRRRAWCGPDALQTASRISAHDARAPGQYARADHQ